MIFLRKIIFRGAVLLYSMKNSMIGPLMAMRYQAVMSTDLARSTVRLNPSRRYHSRFRRYSDPTQPLLLSTAPFNDGSEITSQLISIN